MESSWWMLFPMSVVDHLIVLGLTIILILELILVGVVR